MLPAIQRRGAPRKAGRGCSCNADVRHRLPHGRYAITMVIRDIRWTILTDPEPSSMRKSRRLTAKSGRLCEPRRISQVRIAQSRAITVQESVSGFRRNNGRSRLQRNWTGLGPKSRSASGGVPARAAQASSLLRLSNGLLCATTNPKHLPVHRGQDLARNPSLTRFDGAVLTESHSRRSATAVQPFR
jgi:hypothetical protein